ncbi:polysaccharide deacetylase [Aurantimonas aggregata]|uniref:Polysaccharide deacetylase n=1 Tax=Aurantimonas aggregata TaxID=2047720 RepID=A0A6L9MIT0_9HYPH|nr:polysaccharide deacetylase [Aurantimonas aggregata]NDV87546.1 polysaccharide deacetylase [Aurantimonas aggregata]
MSRALFPLAAAGLDAARDAGCRLDLWWRDDDVQAPGAALDRLLALRRAAQVPLALAAIPAGSGRALTDRLAGEADIVLLQHGFCHANHAPSGEKRAEFGDHRPTAVMRSEIARGRLALADLFPERFLPVFVPPWNRIGAACRAALPGLGLPVLSVFGPAGGGAPRQVNTHLDIIDWRAKRGLTAEEADSGLAREIALRIAAGPAREPIGFLTHHLQHDAAAWMLLAALLDLLAPSEPAVCWPELPSLLAPSAP